MFKKITVKAISGQIGGMSGDTSSKDLGRPTWFRTSVHVEVYDTALRRRITGANRHLIDGYGDDVDTSA